MAANNTKIAESLKKIAKQNKINISNQDFDKTLKSLGVDSISAINLVVKIEQEFNITIPDDQLTNIKTCNDIVNTISKLISK